MLQPQEARALTRAHSLGNAVIAETAGTDDRKFRGAKWGLHIPPFTPRTPEAGASGYDIQFRVA